MVDSADLKSKAIKGSLWSLFETFSLQIIQFVIGVVLARLLEPKDFGLIALTVIFTNVSAAITDGGFEKTLIQREKLSQLQISSVFYLNILLGIMMTSCLIIAAPFIAVFFNAPELTAILRVTSLMIFLTSLYQTQRALLLKNLNFKKISKVQMATSIIGGITGLTLALTGFGVWALVYAALIPQFFKVLFFWIKAPWYPGLQFSFDSIRSMIPYGINVLASSVFYFIIHQFNVFIVGKFYSKTELGLFNRGSRFPELIVSSVQNVVLKMTLPIFSKLQSEKEQLLHTVKKTTKIISFVSFPLLFILLIKAEDVTIFLFTEKWRGSIIFLQLFCLIKIFEPFITVHRELLLAQGHSRLLLKVFTVTSLVEIAVILWVIRYGILYLVLATFLSRAGQYLTYITINARRLGSGWSRELSWHLPYLFLTGAMIFFVLAAQYGMSHSGIDFSLFWKLMIQIPLGLFIYGFFAYKFKIGEIDFIRSVGQTVLEKVNLRKPTSLKFSE